MFHSILVPLDRSPDSEIALPLACAIARTTGGELDLLTVTPADGEEARTEALAYLQATAQLVCDAGLSVHTCVRVGEVATEIVGHAASHTNDLIVVATRAPGPRSIVALTSVVQEVAIQSPCPVLVTRRHNHQPEQFRTLLVPVDGSPGGSLALAATLALARSADSRIVVLNVVVPVPSEAVAALPGMTVGGFVDPAWEDLAHTSADAYVAGLAGRLQASGIETEARVATGEIPDEIVRCAVEVDADIIVMSTHVVGWPARAYVASVANQVIRMGQRPVLLVRREALPE
jgi:nucleotide-binding universal stress UspA family protein